MTEATRAPAVPGLTPALKAGLARVGVGKAGSKDCDAELVDRIIQELRTTPVSPVSKAAFFTSLWLKGVTGAETKLACLLPEGALTDPVILTDALAADSSVTTRATIVSLLRGHHFDRAGAHAAGTFLFGPEKGDAGRAMIASVMRMRHADTAEYCGILDAMHEVISPAFAAPAPTGAPILQLADPFDGVDHSTMITPLIAAHMKRQGFRVVALTGRCSGPKYGLNLMDLADRLGAPRLRRIGDLAVDPGDYGYQLKQEDLTRRFDDWVDLRRQTLKRPFMATAEKLVNPLGCDVYLASVFHHNYSETMTEVCEALGIPASIIAFKAVEGTLGLSLARATRLTLSARRPDGTYRRETMSVSPQDFGIAPQRDEALETVDLERNARMITDFMATGSSGDEYFDQRVTYTRQVYDQALAWIRGG